MTRTFVAALLAAVLPAVALGQRAEPPPPTTERLLMVLKAGPDIDDKKMRDTMENALKAISPGGQYVGSVVDKEPSITPITAAKYNAYAALENPNFKPIDVPTSKTGEVEVKQLEAAGAWEFNLLGDGEPVLRKLEVKFKGEKEPTAFEPSRAKGSPLSMTVFGSYGLKLDPKKVPESYTASLEKTGTDGKTTAATDTGTWPKGSNFFLVRLDGFNVRYRPDLSKVIKDKALVGSAFKSFDIRTNVTLAVGDAEAGGGKRERVRFEGNKLFVSVPPLDQPVSQAYIYFPMNEKEAAAKVAELNDKSENELSKFIRAERVWQPADDAIIAPGMKPAWIKLPPITRDEAGFTVGDFGRVLTLGGKADTKPAEFKKLLDQFDGKDPHWVVVYEFENPTQNIRTVVPASLKPGDKPLKANHEPIDLWSVTLSKLAGEEPPKKEEK